MYITLCVKYPPNYFNYQLILTGSLCMNTEEHQSNIEPYSVYIDKLMNKRFTVSLIVNIERVKRAW